MNFEGMLGGGANHDAAVERYYHPPSLAENSHPAIKKFVEAACRQIEKPLGGEVSTKAFWQAVVDHPEGTLLTPTVIDFMENRAGLIFISHEDLASQTPDSLKKRRNYEQKLEERIVDDEVLGVFRTSVIHTCRKLDPDFSDTNRRTPADWQMPLEAFTGVVDKRRRDPLAAEADTNLNVRKVTTTLLQRYVPTEVIVQCLRERFPKGIRMLEIGPGVMAGAKHLLNKELYPMETSSTICQDSDEDLTEKVNRLLSLPSLIKEAVCVDVEPIFNEDREMYDPGAVEWSISSLRPSERNDPSFLEKFYTILAVKDRRIRFYYLNLLKQKHLVDFKDEQDNKFDVIVRNTNTHQLSAKHNKVMDAALMDLAGPNAVVIEQDFMYLNPGSQSGPVPFSARRIKKEWTEPFSYTTNIVDLAQEKIGFQKVFDFQDNSRCQHMRIHGGGLEINDQVWPIVDIIKQQTV